MGCIARVSGLGMGLKLWFVPTVNQRMKIFALWICAMLGVGLAGPFSAAQVSASLSGVITDPSGAAVVGASVTAKSLDTGASRTTATDQTGRYRFFLPVGLYEVRV